MSGGYTVEQTARLVSALRWATGRLSGIVGAWAAEGAGEAAAGTVWMTSLGRRLGSHCEALAELQPDSVLLAPYRDARPPDGAVDDALEEIAALEGSPGRFAVAVHVLVPGVVGACEEVCSHAAPHCDAALAAAADRMRHDLSRHLGGEDGADSRGSASGGLPETDGPAAVAGRLLAAAGGIVPRSLLRPDG